MKVKNINSQKNSSQIKMIFKLKKGLLNFLACFCAFIKRSKLELF